MSLPRARPTALAFVLSFLLLFSGCAFRGAGARGAADTASARAVHPPDITLALDGVPYDIIETLWAEGRFPGFCRPARMIAPFPSLTLLAHSDIWRAGAVGGYEDRFYDAGKGGVRGGFGSRLTNERPDAFHEGYAFEESKLHGVLIYLMPRSMSGLALGRLRTYLASTDGPRAALLNSTDPIAHVGTDAALRRYLESVAGVVGEAAARGARVTLFSDHGNDRLRSRRVDLVRALRGAGLAAGGGGRVAPGRAVVPAYGLVGFAAVHVDPADRDRAASALAATPGVELVAWEESPGVVRILGPGGEARVRRRDPGAGFGETTYGYEPLGGDPLELGGAADERDAAGWLATAASDVYPDAPRRLLRAFSDDLVRERAALLVSLEDGTHAGPALFGRVVKLRGTHGGLGRAPTTGFVMTNWTHLPEALRSEDVHAYLPGWRPGREESHDQETSLAAR